VADPPAEAANFRRKSGSPEGDSSLKGLASAGTPANGADAAKGTASDAANGGIPRDVTETGPTAIDTTTDRKQGGLPAARPVGATPKEPVTIPPPSNIPPPPANIPPPTAPEPTPPPPAASAPPASTPPPAR
jgi:hypothetical protein